MEGDLQRTVGRNLRAYRLARGLSQEAFAGVLGVHRTYMGDIERGERNLTLKSVERIAGRIELDPLSLLLPEQLHQSPPGRPGQKRQSEPPHS
jgi:transcriptional regulator with XRE-family HTH domain